MVEKMQQALWISRTILRIITEQQHCVEILPAACKATAECIFQQALQCEDLLSQAAETEDADTQQWSHCVEIGSCIMKGRGQVHFQTHALHVGRWKKMTEFMVKSFWGGVLREVVFIVRSIVNCHLRLKRCPAFARTHELRIDLKVIFWSMLWWRLSARSRFPGIQPTKDRMFWRICTKQRNIA